MTNPPKPVEHATPTAIAFLIEGAMDDWTATPECLTRERAASNALLARYAVFVREDLDPVDPLDIEALALFHAGSAHQVTWQEFTEKQRDHWRAIAHKARELHGTNTEDAEREKEVLALIGALKSADWQDATLQQLAEAAYEFGVRVVHEV